MPRHYFYLFLLLSSLATAQDKVQVLANPETMEDFEHEIKGCPENSECDQVMGLQMGRWKELLGKVKDQDPKTRAKEIEAFRSKYGLPVEIYTTQKSKQGFNPIFYSSPCKGHNPPLAPEKIVRGVAFIKGISESKGVVWRDQTQMEVPIGELFRPQLVTVYFPKEEKSYYLPLGDQPLFIEGQDLVVLREEDDFFYALKVSSKGAWSVIDLDFTKLSQWSEKRENVSCPAENKKAPNEFGATFCRSVWSESAKAPLTVKMSLGCAN